MTPYFLAFLAQVTHYLTAVKVKKKYRVENFRANVFNTAFIIKMMSKVQLVLILLLRILTVIILLLLNLVVSRGLLREELLLSFPYRICVHLTSFAMDAFAVILFEVSVEGS